MSDYDDVELSDVSEYDDVELSYVSDCDDVELSVLFHSMSTGQTVKGSTEQDAVG